MIRPSVVDGLDHAGEHNRSDRDEGHGEHALRDGDGAGQATDVDECDDCDSGDADEPGVVRPQVRTGGERDRAHDAVLPITNPQPAR